MKICLCPGRLPSRRLSQPRFVLSRLAGRKMRLSREPAVKNNWLSRREKCGLSTENPLLQFSTSASYSPRPYSQSLVGAVMFSLCLYNKSTYFHCTAVITKYTHDIVLMHFLFAV